MLILRNWFTVSFLLAAAAVPHCVPAQSPSPPLMFAGDGQSAPKGKIYAAGEPSGAAAEIRMGNPFGVEIVGSDVWLTTVDDHCIWRTTIDGRRMVRVGGTGQSGYAGDGGDATEAEFNWPHEVRADREGNLLVADTRNHVIRRIDADSGLVTTIAGTGTPGFAGDGGHGKSAQFKQPHSVVLDGRGGLLVADTQNHRLRRIDLESGRIDTVAGDGRRSMPVDGARADETSLFGPRSLAVDERSLWIALREGNSIWRVDRDAGTIHHVAGTGKKGYSGDGGPPQQATFSGPKGIVIDHLGRLLVVDTENHAVRRIDLKANVIETVLGGRVAESTAPLKRPHGISHHVERGFIVADSENHRVLIGH